MNEKEFEDILCKYPGLIEDGLSLTGRQVNVKGKHVDLIFQDRYGQTLIIELKQGAVKREHIAQLLDYEGYFVSLDNPLVRVMLVGNRVPPNLKKALDHHGFEWKELPESTLIKVLKDKKDNRLLLYFDEFNQGTNGPQKEAAMKANYDSDVIEESLPSSKLEPVSATKQNKNYHFQSKGSSAFINEARSKLEGMIDKVIWKIGGSDSLTVEFIPTTTAIKNRIGRGLKTQIWIERPQKGEARCKFEVANKVDSLDVDSSTKLRDKIADSIRRYMEQKGLDDYIEPATKSTVVAVRLDLPRIKEPKDDIKENAIIYPSEINKIFNFIKFLENQLRRWKDSSMFIEATAPEKIPIS